MSDKKEAETLSLPHEIELKFRVKDIEEVRKRLHQIGASLSAPRRLMRRCIFDRTYNPGISCTYIRVRDEGEQLTLSAKQTGTNGGHIEEQRELCVRVDDYEKTIRLLQHCGLIITGRQETYRETWVFGAAEIVIDEWPHLPPYVEVEAQSKAELGEVCLLLGLKLDDGRTVPTNEFYAEDYGLTSSEALSHMRNLTFAEPFAK